MEENGRESSGDNTEMKDVTIFTMPRCFKPPFRTLQYNAIRSWKALDPTPEIILCGNDEGVAEAAAELKVVHIPDIKLSETGGPLIDSVFSVSKSKAKNDVLACVNSDIILVSDFLDTLDTVTSVFPHRFMIVGQRWDLEIPHYINFSNSSWEDILRVETTQYGKLHPACGIDYFVFEKKIEIKMLPFPVGRTCWDNWFILQALRIGIDVVDATEKLFAVHQEHRQFHIKEYMNNRTGKESTECRKLAQGSMADIGSANWKFLNNKLIKK